MEEPKPGLYAGLSSERYHRAPGVNQSKLKIMRDKSAAHLRYYLEHPPQQTDSMRLGAAIHDAVLLPDEFERLWQTAKQCEGVTKQGKQCTKTGSVVEDGKHFCHVHAASNISNVEPEPVTLLSPADYQTCLNVRDAVRAHPRASKLLTGRAERSAFWIDEETGVLCKGRFDLLSTVFPAIVDLKTCRDASPEAFARTIWEYGYHLQAGHYLDGERILDIYGGEEVRFATVAVEKEPPYCVAIYEIGEEWLDSARLELRALIRQYADCLESGIWPGYSDKVEPIEPPRWARYEMKATKEVLGA